MHGGIPGGRLFAAIFIGGSILFLPGARGGITDWLQPNSQGMEVAIFLPTVSRASAVLRIERSFVDYDRRGFFRIGLLPILVCDGVTLEFREPATVHAALSKAADWFKADKASRAIELRSVRLQLTRPRKCELHAERVRVAADGRWQLSDVCWKEDSSRRLAIPQATLKVTGAEAGQLIWVGPEGVRTISVFAPATAPISTPEPPPLP